MLPGRVHIQRPRPRKAAPAGSKIEPRGGQNDLLEASGELLGGSWAPDGRQDRSGSAPGRGLGRPEALLGGAWGVLAALGALLGALWAILTRPGGPREASGGSGEGLREAILVLFLVVMQKKPVKVQKSSCFIDVGCFFGPCFGLGFRLIFACVACARRRSRHRQIMEILWFLWVARHRRVFGQRRKG